MSEVETPRRPRFRLRTLMLAVAVVALGLGVFVTGIRVERLRAEREHERVSLELKRVQEEELRQLKAILGSLDKGQQEPRAKDREADDSVQ